jgi:hypothetical protein
MLLGYFVGLQGCDFDTHGESTWPAVVLASRLHPIGLGCSTSCMCDHACTKSVAQGQAGPNQVPMQVDRVE